jgi:2-oxo-3-hexenedioate decarboxylase
MATLSSDIVDALAAHLYEAQTQGRAVVKVTDAYPELDDDDAYAIQYAMRRLQLAGGQRLVGLKMGLTSRAKMKQMGVESPIYGYLMENAYVPEGSAIDTAPLIHPKIEAEVAFMTRAALKGPNCTVAEVMAATDFVMPAMEVIDSRYENFRFDLRSVIADNTSASRFVTGGRTYKADDIDLRTMGVVMEKNGEVVQVGAGAAVLGHPAESVASLANMLAVRGEDIPAGTFVMTGGITAAVAVDKGDTITTRYQHLGSLTVRFT